MVHFAMINEVYILEHCKSGNVCRCLGKKSCRLLCIVSNHHELVVELREKSFDSFSGFLVRPCRRSPILLVQPIGYFKVYVSSVKKVLLNLGTEIAFVTEQHAIVVFPLHIIQITKVVNVCGGHVIRMDNPTYPADSVEFIPVIMYALRSAIAPLWSKFIIAASHCTTVGTCILADLDRLGIDAENILLAVHGSSNVLTYFLSKPSSKSTSLIELPATNQIGKTIAFYSLKSFEQIVLAVNPKCLGCGREGDDLEVGKLGDNATMWAIPVLIHTISCVFFDYVKDFTELYDEVVHIRDDSNQWFYHH